MSRQFTAGGGDQIIRWFLARAVPGLVQPNWTLLAWFNATTVGSYRGVMGMIEPFGGVARVRMRLSGGGGLAYDWAGTGDEYDAAGPPIVTGEWTMGAVTITPNLATIYTGTLTKPLSSKTNAKTHSPIGGASPLLLSFVGQDYTDTSRTFDGLISDPAIYDVALTRAELELYRQRVSPLQIRRASLLFHASMPPSDSLGDEVVGNGNIGGGQGNHQISGACPVSQNHLPRRFQRIVVYRDVPSAGGTVTGDASATGTGEATGVGEATAAATAAATGAGEALGVGSYTLAATDAVANAAGTGTATAVGAATAAAIANAAGLGEALGVGAAIGIISAVGNAAGTSEALGYSPTLLGGGESGRPGLAGRKRRKRIEWLPPDYDIETGERLPPPEAAAPVKLSKGERKVARLVAQYRGRDDDVAERARESLEALHRAQNSELARFIARQQALDDVRSQRAAAAAEDDEAAIAFMQWLLRQP